MNILKSCRRCRTWVMVLALGALTTGCARDSILGSSGIAADRPIVVATPANGATSVVTKNLNSF